MKLTLSISILALAATGAAAQDLPQASSEWFTAAQSELQQRLAREPNTRRARNVILLVADGNGVGTNYATRLWVGQQQGELGEEHVLPYETPEFHSALVKTYNINAQTPDSAPTGGAMNTGVKQEFNTINLAEAATWDDCSTVAGNELTTFAEMLDDKAVGIVSTARLTHATPAAVYAKTANRNWEDAVPEGCTAQTDIAAQLIDAMAAGTVDLALGGGRRHFAPEGATVDEGTEGVRADGVNLIDQATGAGARYAWNTETFEALDLAADAPVLGLFEDSHMKYEADRTDEDEPSLEEMTRAAIEYLQNRGGDGFYLAIEAGRVDHASHAGNAYRTVTDGAEFAEAVAAADELTNDEDTLIVVTADHEHAIAFNGYCGRGTPILGLCYEVDPEGPGHADTLTTGSDGKPYTVIGYLNGAGSVLIEQEDGAYSGERPDVTQEQATDIDYLQQALVPMSSETHSGEDVAVYAKGPFAHLFDGTMEQNLIFHVMHHAVTVEDTAAADRRQTAEDVLPVSAEAREDATESLQPVEN